MKQYLIFITFVLFLAFGAFAEGTSVTQNDKRLHTISAINSAQYYIELEDGTKWGFDKHSYPIMWSVNDNVYVTPTSNNPNFSASLYNVFLQMSITPNSCSADSVLCKYISEISDCSLTSSDGTTWVIDWSTTQMWHPGDFICIGGQGDSYYIINASYLGYTNAKLSQTVE